MACSPAKYCLYGEATLFVGLALALSLLIESPIPHASVYLLLASVVASAWRGGKITGICAAFIATLTLDYFFLPPRHTFGVTAEALSYLVSFFLSALAAAWMSSTRRGAGEAQANSARLMQAVDQAGHGIVVTDRTGQIQYVNRAFSLMTGYAAEEAIGQNPRILKSDRQDRSYYAELWRTINSGQLWHGELINRRKDGTIYTEEMKIAPVLDRAGVITNFIAFKQDVTKSSRQNQELLFKTTLLEAQAETTLDGILVVGDSGSIVLSNSRFAEMWRIPPEVISAGGARAALNCAMSQAADPNAFLEGVRHRYANPKEKSRDEVKLKDGTVLDQFSSPLIDRSGKYWGRIWYFPDITQRKRAEEALRHSEEQFRQLAENIREVFFVGEIQPARVIYLSPAYEELWGRPRQEVYDRADAWTESIHPEDRDQMSALLSQAYQGEEAEGQYRVVRPDGSVRSISMRLSPVRDARGKFYRFVGLAEDVTAAKHVEAEIIRAKEAAEASSRAKSDFLANMSHEIRTPMNAIMGMTDLVLDTELTSRQREDLEIVKSSADSLLRLINDILDFSKIEARKLDLEHIEFNLRSCVENACKALGDRCAAKNLELVCHCAPNVPLMVIGDPGRLRQILFNLVGNAVKFTNQGEVVVYVEKLAGTGDEPVLQFSVSDTGIGIPQAKHKAIFDAFTQADASSTRRYGGTGLGLTITAQLVRMMGGRIWLESEPGKGSTFRFTLRLEEADSSQAHSARASTSILRDLRVLIADDNATNLKILEEVLTGWGMKPAVTRSGSEALDHLKRARDAGQPYPLVLTDSQMPDMDGFTLAERARQELHLAGATIMMLTSGGRKGDGERCRELGVSAYITKPVGESELLAAVLEALARTDPASPPKLITRHSLRENGSGLQILVVEDNRVNQQLASRLLQKQGHSTAVAQSGCEALALTESQSFDLVLMDVQMPDMDGLEATRAIREREVLTGGHLPVIAMTAHAMRGDRERCLSVGMDGYISKPFKSKELYSAIEAALNRSVADEPTAEVIAAL